MNNIYERRIFGNDYFDEEDLRILAMVALPDTTRAGMEGDLIEILDQLNDLDMYVQVHELLDKLMTLSEGEYDELMETIRALFAEEPSEEPDEW